MRWLRNLFRTTECSHEWIRRKRGMTTNGIGQWHRVYTYLFTFCPLCGAEKDEVLALTGEWEEWCFYGY